MAADATIVPDALEEIAAPQGRHGASAWAAWLARRLGLAVLTLWLVSILVFFATSALGDPVRAILGKDYNSSPGRVAQLQAQRQFLGRWLDLRVAREQQGGFEVSEPRRHYQIIGRQLQLERARLVDESDILIDQCQDRDLLKIDLLGARQRQQQIERPFPAIDRDRQRRGLGWPEIEFVFIHQGRD